MSAFGDIKDGYPGLAKVMGPNSDQGFGIYKCFAELNARNLLMMQAELLGLEEELKTLTFLDESCPDPTRKAFARNVWRMRNTKNSEQWAKVLEIREKLQAYSESFHLVDKWILANARLDQCLLQQAQLARLGKVNMYDLRLLIHWLEHQDGGNQFLQNFEQSVWDEQNIRDLVSISGRDPRDGLLRWFHQKLLPNLHHRIIELWRVSVFICMFLKLDLIYIFRSQCLVPRVQTYLELTATFSPA